ncbi:MAG: glycosyltransferase [Anaerolineales bacterium]|uniref:glycosyltransferase n=1 Tax=Promineifilum sp. TaxID=2664178 RepID=UPI001DA9B682|nr:glycosyltransferase [Anaerolineales bacterium]MCB8934589.1 glycosyltransferase [Promineifilum sp.]MCO5180893.1 glycosyltransferase [Promineifilum sp.]
METIRCSLGIMAHNEEANIGRLLARVRAASFERVEIAETLVVASGCTDRTEDVVHEAAAADDRIRLISQPTREGKASAMNEFISQARCDVLVLSSADLLPAEDAIEQLVRPFADPEIGMTASRPVPVNDPATFMGFAAHLLWDLHHEMNLQGFKAGEMIAFRKVFERIPPHTAVDEASVEPLVRGQGYAVRYVPEAVVYNKGPETVEDFLRQRRRIYAGHLEMKSRLGYAVSTMSGAKIVGLLLRNMDWRPKQLWWTARVVALEVYGRYLGRQDYKARRSHTVWEIAETTKELELL